MTAAYICKRRDARIARAMTQDQAGAASLAARNWAAAARWERARLRRLAWSAQEAA